MLIVYLQIVTKNEIHKKHHFKDEKYKEKSTGILCPKDKGYRILKGGVKPNWAQLNSLC